MPGPVFRQGDAVGLHTVEEDDLAFLQRLRNDPSSRARTAATAPENMDELSEWFEEDVSAPESEDAHFLVVPSVTETLTESQGISTGPPASPTESKEGVAVAASAEAEADRDAPPIGFVSLIGIERPAGRGEVVCMIDRSAMVGIAEQESQFAREALELLVGYAIEERRLHRIVARTPADHETYRSVLESAGFTVEFTQREEWFVDGEHLDIVSYSLISDEWGGD